MSGSCQLTLGAALLTPLELQVKRGCKGRWLTPSSWSPPILIHLAPLSLGAALPPWW